VKRILIGTLAVVGLAACKKESEPQLQMATTVADYRDITVTAEATGKIEPINVVDIKSKAGGQIIQMPVETGTRVQKGDIIVKLDPRDVQSRYDQAKANFDAATARVANAEINKERNDQLFAAKVLTAREHEQSALDLTNARTALLSSQAALDLAQQQKDDATITAPSAGVILEKIVSMGTVIASASGSASGGTTLVRMADLSEVRAKVLVTETDIGKVTEGLTAQVLVDAFPGRVFVGVVEKIEPIAVVEQNVTMFPVLVRLPNADGALKPGMNGEIGILVDSKQNVLAVHPDAIRTQQVAAQIAPQFGLTTDQVNEAIRVQRSSGGRDLDAPGGDDSASVPVGGRVDSTRGGQPGRQGGGRGQQIQVTDAQCQQVATALAAAPNVQKQIADIRAKFQDPAADRTVLTAEMAKIYTDAGLDQRVVSACSRRSMGAQGGRGGGQAGGRGGRGGNTAGGRGGRGGGRGAGGNGGASGEGPAGALGQRPGGATGRMLPTEGVVYVEVGTDSAGKPKFEPRWIRMGIQDFDSVEILAGLRAGERVAMLAQAVLQNQRDQARARQQQSQSVIPGANAGQRGGPGGGSNRGGGRGGGGGGRGGML